MESMINIPATCTDYAGNTSDGSDNADLLDFCFLCSRQFFHETLDFITETGRDEDILETFFEELGPVDRCLLGCCPGCKALCKTLISTKEELSRIIDEIFGLLLRSRTISKLVSKNHVISRLFQSPGVSLAATFDTPSTFLQPPLTSIQFPKVMSDTGNLNLSTAFPSQFGLKLSNGNLDSMDLALIQPPPPTATVTTEISVEKKLLPLPKKSTSNYIVDTDKPSRLILSVPVNCNSNSGFSSLYNESMMNSVSDNACDIDGLVVVREDDSELNNSDNAIPPFSLPQKLPLLTIYPANSTSKERKNSANLVDPGEGHSEEIKIANVFLGMDNTPKEDVGNSGKIDNNLPENPVTITTLTSHTNQPKEIKALKPKRTRTKKLRKQKSKITTPKKAELKKEEPKKTEAEKTSELEKLLRHTKHYCAQCKRSFKNARNLKNHIAAHTEERRFICVICGASYRHKKGLDAHLAMHDGSSQFKCDICEKSFTQNSGLRRHMLLHSGQFRLQCEECGKQYVHHSSLILHRRIHEGRKEFECEICELKFTHKSHLDRHNRVHSGEKLHDCPSCDRKFSEKYNLRVHMRSHEGKEAVQCHICPFCPKKFTRKNKLNHHINSNHTSRSS